MKCFDVFIKTVLFVYEVVFVQSVDWHSSDFKQFS